MSNVRRHTVDHIMGFGQPERWRRAVSCVQPKRWERRSVLWRQRVLTGLPDDRKWGLKFNDWGHHCKWCAAVDAPVHERVHGKSFR